MLFSRHCSTARLGAEKTSVSSFMRTHGAGHRQPCVPRCRRFAEFAGASFFACSRSESGQARAFVRASYRPSYFPRRLCCGVYAFVADLCSHSSCVFLANSCAGANTALAAPLSCSIQRRGGTKSPRWMENSTRWGMRAERRRATATPASRGKSCEDTSRAGTRRRVQGLAAGGCFSLGRVSPHSVAWNPSSRVLRLVGSLLSKCSRRIFPASILTLRLEKE